MKARSNQETLERLQEAKESNPALTEIVDLQHDLLEAQMQANIHPAAPHYSQEEVRARFARGVPLLNPQEMTLDWEPFTNLYQQVCRIAARHRLELATQFEELLAMLDEDPDNLQAITTSYLENGRLGLENEEEQGELLTFVLNHALRPFLKTYADALAPVVKQERWQRGRCPVCNGEPDIAFLDAEVGARYLVCSRCDSQWLFLRVRCPFCNTSEPSDLSYYPSEDEKYRLYVCQSCKRYLKTVDLRKAGRSVLFPVERITTVDLDIAAHQEGYH